MGIGMKEGMDIPNSRCGFYSYIIFGLGIETVIKFGTPNFIRVDSPAGTPASPKIVLY